MVKALQYMFTATGIIKFQNADQWVATVLLCSGDHRRNVFLPSEEEVQREICKERGYHEMCLGSVLGLKQIHSCANTVAVL